MAIHGHAGPEASTLYEDVVTSWARDSQLGDTITVERYTGEPVNREMVEELMRAAERGIQVSLQFKGPRR